MLVKVINNNLGKALKKLSQKLDNDGLFKLLKDRRYYKSKSEKRREKTERAILRIKKNEKKAEENFLKFEENLLRNRSNKRNKK